MLRIIGVLCGTAGFCCCGVADALVAQTPRVTLHGGPTFVHVQERSVTVWTALALVDGPDVASWASLAGEVGYVQRRVAYDEDTEPGNAFDGAEPGTLYPLHFIAAGILGTARLKASSHGEVFIRTGPRVDFLLRPDGDPTNEGEYARVGAELVTGVGLRQNRRMGLTAELRFNLALTDRAKGPVWDYVGAPDTFRQNSVDLLVGLVLF